MYNNRHTRSTAVQKQFLTLGSADGLALLMLLLLTVVRVLVPCGCAAKMAVMTGQEILLSAPPPLRAYCSPFLWNAFRFPAMTSLAFSRAISDNATSLASG